MLLVFPQVLLLLGFSEHSFAEWSRSCISCCCCGCWCCCGVSTDTVRGGSTTPVMRQTKSKLNLFVRRRFPPEQPQQQQPGKQQLQQQQRQELLLRCGGKCCCEGVGDSSLLLLLTSCREAALRCFGSKTLQSFLHGPESAAEWCVSLQH